MLAVIDIDQTMAIKNFLIITKHSKCESFYLYIVYTIDRKI